jgi:hypothetical protein
MNDPLGLKPVIKVASFCATGLFIELARERLNLFMYAHLRHLLSLNPIM